MASAPVIPTALIMAGGYLAWFGVHYWRSDTRWPTDPIKAVLTGKPLPTPAHTQEQADQQAVAHALVTGAGLQPGAEPTGGLYPHGNTTGGGAIAAAALKYQGQGYVWAGNASAPGRWDCSSFCSYVLGHDLGLPLPGGKWGDPGFPPHTHGPTTGSYALYGTAVSQSALVAGDLVVWATHMGIATDSSHLISARTPAAGTGVDTITSMSASLGEVPLFRRVL